MNLPRRFLAAENRSAARRYGVAVVAVGMAVLVKWSFIDQLGEPTPFLLFSAAVMTSAWFGGMGSGLFATFLVALTAQFFFPHETSHTGIAPERLVQVLAFLVEGSVISLLGGAHAATRRVSIEARREVARQGETLRAGEEQFRLLVEGVKEYAISMVDPEGYVVSWNEGAERITGYRPRDILRRHWSVFFTPEDVEAGVPADQLRAAAGEGRHGTEGRRVRRDGSRFWADVSITSLHDEAGALRGFATVTRDVSERKAAADTERELRAALHRHADELERRVEQRTKDLQEANGHLEAFAYSISHDLRAPLRAMQGFGAALLEDYGERLDDEGRGYAGRIMAASHRMEALIRDLLAYSRVSRADLALSPVDLESIVSRAIARLREEVPVPDARISVDGPLPPVRGHAATVEQIVANLLGNAVKFTAPSVTPEIRVRAERRDDAVRLWVEDNGIGIAPQHQERIFRVFERLHGPETYPGTGIGLALVAKGVSRMGGRAGVKSVPGEGSRFWIELPSPEATDG